MNEIKFLKQNHIVDFIIWIESFLDNSFNHSYIMKKEKKDWKCNSIYNAYENYTWSNKGESFNESHKELSSIKKKLLNSLKNNNEPEAKEACIDILKWGGLENHNDIYIKNNHDIICELNYIKTKINPSNYDTDRKNIIDIKINSGFSKIYSILMDNYIIYDSRVSVAICFFIRKYCEEKCLKKIPLELKFAFYKGRAEGEDRNPNKDDYIFPNLYQSNYLENNIKASWLLSGILKKTKSKFNDLPIDIQLRALEAAFFMIGYKI